MAFLRRELHSPESEFAHLFERMHQLCNENEWGDPFATGRAREIYMANTLGHGVGPTLSGADAYEDEERTIPVEYKATTNASIKATYTGISVKNTWTEQLDYLRQEKICKYPRHYFARFDGSTIAEIYCMDCDKVLEGLLPALQRQFNSDRSRRADPRLQFTLCQTYIRANSRRIDLPT